MVVQPSKNPGNVLVISLAPLLTLAFTLCRTTLKSLMLKKSKMLQGSM